jgi:hypothetical protein
MTRSDVARTTGSERKRALVWFGAAFLVVAFMTSVALAAVSERQSAAPFDADLPNPMGGPARAAPGDSSGEIVLAGLRIRGADVAMGQVPLGVTLVPTWEVENPTADPIGFEVWEPEVIEGCCPGPIYVDGQLTRIGEPLEVPPRGSVRLQFPLQMHPGMDGPHHLAIPVTSGDDAAIVQVTGDFTAGADG